MSHVEDSRGDRIVVQIFFWSPNVAMAIAQFLLYPDLIYNGLIGYFHIVYAIICRVFLLFLRFSIKEITIAGLLWFRHKRTVT